MRAGLAGPSALLAGQPANAPSRLARPPESARASRVGIACGGRRGRPTTACGGAQRERSGAKRTARRGRRRDQSGEHTAAKTADGDSAAKTARRGQRGRGRGPEDEDGRRQRVAEPHERRRHVGPVIDLVVPAAKQPPPPPPPREDWKERLRKRLGPGHRPPRALAAAASAAPAVRGTLKPWGPRRLLLRNH